MTRNDPSYRDRQTRARISNSVHLGMAPGMAGVPYLAGALGGLAYGGGKLWASSAGAAEAYEFDTYSLQVVQTTSLPTVCSGYVAGGGAGMAWFASTDSSSSVYGVSPNGTVLTVVTGIGENAISIRGDSEYAYALYPGGGDGFLYKIDRFGKILTNRHLPVSFAPTGMAEDGSKLYIVNASGLLLSLNKTDLSTDLSVDLTVLFPGVSMSSPSISGFNEEGMVLTSSSAVAVVTRKLAASRLIPIPSVFISMLSTPSCLVGSKLVMAGSLGVLSFDVDRGNVSVLPNGGPGIISAMYGSVAIGEHVFSFAPGMGYIIRIGA